MSIFAQDSSGDLTFTDGRLAVLTGIEETLIRMKNRVGLAQGEWFLDQRVGIPYYKFVFVKNPDIDLLTRLFREALDSVPGVQEFEEFTLSLGADRELSISFMAKHWDGDVMTGGLGGAFIAEDEVSGS